MLSLKSWPKIFSRSKWFKTAPTCCASNSSRTFPCTLCHPSDSTLELIPISRSGCSTILTASTSRSFRPRELSTVYERRRPPNFHPDWRAWNGRRIHLLLVLVGRHCLGHLRAHGYQAAQPGWHAQYHLDPIG